MGVTLHLNKLESRSPRETLCQVWLKLSKWFWRRLLHVVNLFLLFPNYLPLGWAWPFIWIDLNSLHLRILCAKLSWNWPSGSREYDLFKSLRFIFIISQLSPIWNGCGPSFEQIKIPFTQEYSVEYSSLVEIGPVVLEKMIKMWKVF